MRFSNIIESVFGQKSKVRLLKALYKARMPLSGRHLSKICKLNHRTCQLSLKSLEKEGVIKSRSAGKSLLFEINKNNFFVREALSKLFDAEDSLLENALNKILKGKKKKLLFESLILFGSVVRGEETPDSDIDLAVILKNKSGRQKAINFFEDINHSFMDIFGNILSPYFITKKDFIRKFKKGLPLIQDIIGAGKVIFGKTPEEIIQNG